MTGIHVTEPWLIECLPGNCIDMILTKHSEMFLNSLIHTAIDYTYHLLLLSASFSFIKARRAWLLAVLLCYIILASPWRRTEAPKLLFFGSHDYATPSHIRAVFVLNVNSIFLTKLSRLIAFLLIVVSVETCAFEFHFISYLFVNEY